MSVTVVKLYIRLYAQTVLQFTVCFNKFRIKCKLVCYPFYQIGFMFIQCLFPFRLS